jgi:hypothetical protein
MIALSECSRRCLRLLLASVGVLVLGTAASATVTVAERGVFWGRVEVSGKTPNTTYVVWEETAPGSGVYGNTGFTLTTDATGSGSVDIPNTTGGRLFKGRNVKIGNGAGPNGQPGRVVTATFFGWVFATKKPGPNPPFDILIDNSITDGGHLFLETWDPGTMLSVTLPPGQAQWLPGTVSATGSGLTLNVVNVMPQTVTIQVVGNTTPLSPSTIAIHGLGVNVSLPVGSTFDVGFEYMGSSSRYRDGVLIGNSTWPTLQSYVGQTVDVVDPITPFCFGDGTGIPCPCNNTGAPNHGCDNQQPTGTGGALLTGTGNPSLSADTLVLNVTNSLNHVHVVFEGTQNTANTRYGAGVRCVTSGTDDYGQSFLKRLAKGTASGGAIAFTGISSLSAIKGAPLYPGETYFYYTAYRDAEMNGAPGCAGLTFGFNATNSLAVIWGG